MLKTKYQVTFKTEIGINIEVEAVDNNMAKNLATAELRKIKWSSLLPPNHKFLFRDSWKIDKVERSYYPIMDTTNAHNKDLVKKINDLWNSPKQPNFELIMLALMNRDLNEMYDKNIFGEASDPDVEAFFDNCVDADYLEANWEMLTEYYLMRVADDGDLETIINFIR